MFIILLSGPRRKPGSPARAAGTTVRFRGAVFAVPFIVTAKQAGASPAAGRLLLAPRKSDLPSFAGYGTANHPKEKRLSLPLGGRLTTGRF